MTMNLKSFFMLSFALGILISISLLKGEDKMIPQKKLSLVINMENHNVLPRNFRMTREPYIPDQMIKTYPSLYGLSKLRASASAQFSEKSLAKILEIVPSNQIILVDLREESHGFINGIAISWRAENNWGNKDKNLEEILFNEKLLLQKTINDKDIKLYQKNSDKDPVLVHVKEAFSEADLAKKMGINYVRIPASDHLKPNHKEVDLFIEFMKNHILKNETSNAWIHLHCSAGRGRSTTFIAMYDMMQNAPHVSFHDILKRQAMIGGKDLFEIVDASDWRYEHNFERIQFLSNFYSYCLKNPNFEQSWSSWISKEK